MKYHSIKRLIYLKKKLNFTENIEVPHQMLIFIKFTWKSSKWKLQNKSKVLDTKPMKNGQELVK